MNLPRTGDMLRTQPMQQAMLGIPGGPFLGSPGGPQQQQQNHIGMMPGNHNGATPMGGLLMQPNPPNNPNFPLQMQQAARMNQQRAHVQQGLNPALGPGSHLGPGPMPGVNFPNTVLSQNPVRRVQSQPGLNQAAGQFGGGGMPGQQMLGINGIPGLGMANRMGQPMQQGPPGSQMRIAPQHSIQGGGLSSDMQMQLSRQGPMGGGSGFPHHIARAPSQNPSMSNIPQPPSLPTSHSGGMQQPPFSAGMVMGGQPMHPQQSQQLSSSPHQVQQGPAGALPNNMTGNPGLQGASQQQRITPERVMYNYPNPHMQPGVPRMAPGGVPMAYPSSSNTPNPQVAGNQQMSDLAQQMGGGNMVGQQRSASRQGTGALLSTPADVLQTLSGTENHSASFMSPHHFAGPAPPRPSSRPRSHHPMAPQLPQQQTPHQPPMAIHRSPRQQEMLHQMQPPGPPRQATPAQSPHRVGMSNTPRVASSQLPQGPHHPNRTPSLAPAQPPQGVIPPPKPPTPAAPQHSQQVPITSRPQQQPPTITSQAPPPPAPAAAPAPAPAPPEAGPSAPPQQPHPPAQPQQALAPRPAAVPQYAVGNGQSVTRLLQFSGALSKVEKSTSRLQLSHWDSLVKEYFTSRATMKLTLWKENQQYEAKPFEIGTPIIPRFFLVTAQSGVQCMSINLDGARERIGSPTHGIVECVQAVWTYKYDDGWTIKLKGPMTAHVIVIPNTSTVPGGQATGSYTLKFDQIQFDAKNYERLLAIETFIPKIPLSPPEQNTPLPEDEAHNNEEPRRVQVGEKEYWQLNSVTVPVSPINAFGIPQATMRCLELAESVTQMADLIQFSNEKSLGPKDALKEFAKQIRERQVQDGGGPHQVMNGIPNSHRLQQPPFPGGGVGPYGQEINGIVPTMPPSSSTSSTLLSGPSHSNQGPPPQQNGPPAIEGTPKMNKALPPQQPIASASTPSASTPAASTPSAATMTPIPAPQTLKRKAGDSSSPNIANAEQQPHGKRARGKRRSTNTG